MADLSNTSYRYQLVAQNFTRNQRSCNLIIRDNETQQEFNCSASLVFHDDDILAQMHPVDVKIIGYIYGFES